MMVRMPMIALAAVLAMSALPAQAQDAEGKVAVTVSTDVENALISSLGLTAEQIPGELELPIGIASQVCAESASELAKQKKDDGTITCTATATSKALEQAVKKQVQ
jgi:hypothetical protein